MGHRENGLSRFEIILLSVLVIVWIPGFMALAEIWSEVDYASHGFLVPFVSLWAATAHRARLASLEIRPVPGGGAWIAAALVLYLVALGLRNASAIGLAAVLTVTVCVLALRGVEWVRTLTFPIAYLLFMVPLPTDWVTPVVVRLQLLMSGVAVSILQSSGVAIYREGNVLQLPGDESLFVAEACSGITSLITLIPIGVFIAYFTESRWQRRAILIAAVLPVALAGNLVRVLVTVQLAIWGNAEWATEGPMHEWAGVATYVIGCGCLLGIGALMRRFAPEPELPIPAGSDSAIRLPDEHAG